VSSAPRLVLGCALLLAAAVLLIIAVLGARGRLRRNPWAGVRTSRTLVSDEAFTVANRVAAAPLGAAGIVALLGGITLVVGGPGAVVWTVLVVATAGMLGLTGLGGALGDRAAARVEAPESGCAGTCAGCDLVAGCRPSPTEAAPAPTPDRTAGPA
jgi:hypothetical protein